MALPKGEFPLGSTWPDRLAVDNAFGISPEPGRCTEEGLDRLEVAFSIRGRNFELALRDRGVGEIAARKSRQEGSVLW